jgi:hypothetical protein
VRIGRRVDENRQVAKCDDEAVNRLEFHGGPCVGGRASEAPHTCLSIHAPHKWSMRHNMQFYSRLKS